MHYLDMAFSLVFGIDEDIIQIHNDKDMKLFREDFIDIALAGCQSVDQLKKHYLILEINVSSPEGSLLIISFANFHLVIGIGEVELGKPPSLPQSV